MCACQQQYILYFLQCLLLHFSTYTSSAHTLCCAKPLTLCLYGVTMLLMQQRAFLLARQREREGGRNRGSPGARGGYDGYESEDSMDSFIDDGDEEDWRVAMRQITGQRTL